MARLRIGGFGPGILKRANAKSLGLGACTAIVIGNMVGSGFYLSPAIVAPYGNLGILVLIIMGAGAACLGLVFARLARLAPTTGGPYAYTRLSSIGALNGWTLLMGQVPMAAANHGLFPPLFGRLSVRKVPATGIVVSAILTTVLVLLQAAGTEGFTAFYKLVVGLGTMTAVIPYAFCALAGSLVIKRFSEGTVAPPVTIVETIAFAFAIFTLIGCGAQPVLYGLVLLPLGVAFMSRCGATCWLLRHSGLTWMKNR